MRDFQLVIAGGGLTAARAIETYRDTGGGGRIALISEETTVPYHRPPLTKAYLRGEKLETPIVKDETFYAERDVELLLEQRVTSVDPVSRFVTTDNGPLHYEKLLVATGARPRRLRVPGDTLEGIFTLRTLQDSRRIRQAAAAAERAVVVGAGFIGMEAAASLRHLGIEVTLIHMGTGLFDLLGSPELSEQLLALYREHHVEVLLEEEVAAFGGDDRLEYVETRSGLCVAADLAVVGVGVVPNVDFLEGSGLVIDDGVVVDEHFEATVPAVYAAGDAANFLDPLFGRRRIEHWSNANYQGAEVGRVLAGAGGGYQTVSSFFTEVFGLTVKVFGDVSRFDTRTSDGSLADGFFACYGNEGRLVGALTVSQSEDFESLVKGLIAERAPAGALEHMLVASRPR